MTATIVIINASNVLTDDQVRAVLPAMQKQIDRDFLPIWGKEAVAARLEFLPWSRRAETPAGAWPIYLNRHSSDPGALGWHTDEGQKIFGRVFVGDCIRYGISWTVDLMQIG